MAPWKAGTRHRSWFADTNIATVAFAVVFLTYVVWEIVATSPPGLTTLLGVAGGAWFGAVSGDKRKRDQEVEQKVDRLERVTEHEHGEKLTKLDERAEHEE